MSTFPEREFFHEGMRAFQDRFDGRRTAEAIEKHRKHYSFWDDEREMINEAPMFFIATGYGDYMDCSVRSGDTGFVKIVGDNVLEYPEYDGNSMYRTLGNIRMNPNVGLLFVKFDGKSRRIRINGQAEIIDASASLAVHFGAKLVVRITCEIYPNCPRYLPNMEWQLASPHVPRPDEGLPPPPEWKERDYIRDILPSDDPHRKSGE